VTAAEKATVTARPVTGCVIECHPSWGYGPVWQSWQAFLHMPRGFWHSLTLTLSFSHQPAEAAPSPLWLLKKPNVWESQALRSSLHSDLEAVEITNELRLHPHHAMHGENR